MKTISGKPISTKPISLSKAAKILSKFVSAENGASQVISIYLHRASSSFSELNQLHRELKSPHSDRKHKSNRAETHEDESKKHETNGVEFEEDSNEVKVSTKAQESLARIVESHRELDDAGDDKGMVEGKKHKREKKRKKGKDSMDNFSSHKSEAIKLEDEKAKKTEDQKDILSNGFEGENGSLNDHQELQNNKKMRYKTGSKDKSNTDEVKRVQKKRKSEDVEGRVEDRASEPTKKIKRKRGRDD